MNKETCWELFIESLKEVSVKYHLQIHAFVLMDNHYHLIVTASEEFNIGSVMCWFQSSVSRKINRISGRTNHVFGGPYRATLIAEPIYYYHAIRYVYQNPVAASMSEDPYLYKYSSLNSDRVPLSCPITGIAALIPKCQSEFENYARKIYELEEREELKLALSKNKANFSARLKRKLARKLKF